MSKKANPVTYGEVFQFLSKRAEKYVEDCSESRKRAIRKFSENILLEDGVLFYLQHEGKEKKEVKSKRQWIHDHQMQQQIFSHFMMILLVDVILDVRGKDSRKVNMICKLIFCVFCGF